MRGRTTAPAQAGGARIGSGFFEASTDLDSVVRVHPGRWGSATVAAASGAMTERRLAPFATASEWIDVLDRIELALASSRLTLRERAV